MFWYGLVSVMFVEICPAPFYKTNNNIKIPTELKKKKNVIHQNNIFPY